MLALRTPRPRSSTGVAALAKSAGADDGDESKDEAKGSRKRNVNAVRINNNELPTLEGLAGALEAHLRDVTKVQWIDVSFNQLSTVPAEVRAGWHKLLVAFVRHAMADCPCATSLALVQELKSFPKLSRLYLHANAITSLAEVEKLQSLGDTLRSLTLHGNPVAEKPLYVPHAPRHPWVKLDCQLT